MAVDGCDRRDGIGIGQEGSVCSVQGAAAVTAHAGGPGSGWSTAHRPGAGGAGTQQQIRRLPSHHAAARRNERTGAGPGSRPGRYSLTSSFTGPSGRPKCRGEERHPAPRPGGAAEHGQRHAPAIAVGPAITSGCRDCSASMNGAGDCRDGLRQGLACWSRHHPRRAGTGNRRRRTRDYYRLALSSPVFAAGAATGRRMKGCRSGSRTTSSRAMRTLGRRFPAVGAHQPVDRAVGRRMTRSASFGRR